MAPSSLPSAAARSVSKTKRPRFAWPRLAALAYFFFAGWGVLARASTARRRQRGEALT